MCITKLKTCVALLVAMGAIAGHGLLAQQTESPASVALGKANPADATELAQTEAKLAKLRELIRPQPGEHVTNMARIAWERDSWVAAVKAGKEGKPVLVYAEGAAGIACGYG